MKKLRALNSSRLPSYAALDGRGSGRCRVSESSLATAFPRGLPLRSGSVIKIKLESILSVGTLTALCTVWPDTQHVLAEGYLCLDISSILLTKTTCAIHYETVQDWTETTCEIVEVIDLRPLSSLCYRSEEKIDVSSLVGLAVTKDCRLHPSTNMPSSFLDISRVNPLGCGVVTTSTIVILDTNPSPLPQSSSSSSSLSNDSFDSVQQMASCTSVVQQIMDRVLLPLVQGVPSSARLNGLLLLGPPGVGKTFALHAVRKLAKDWCCVEVEEVSIPELLTEDRPLDYLRKTLDRMKLPMRASLPCMRFVLLDEVDALGNEHKVHPIQSAIKQMLCDWLDAECNGLACPRGVGHCLIATSNRRDDVDSSLRCGGRLEVEINVLSSTADRSAILNSHILSLMTMLSMEDGMLRPDVLSNQLAERTGGYVAADLVALSREVTTRLQKETDVLHRLYTLSIVEERESVISTLFGDAMRQIGPSCLRGVTLANTSHLDWSDVIGYEEAKASLQRLLSVFEPERRARLERFGLDHSLGGILLYGPPGNSKTRLIAATASTFHLPMIVLSSADIYSAYLGDAEAEVRKAFTIARQAAPCILFFDEMDALVSHRAQINGSSAHNIEARVLATFLNEMDGVHGQAGKQGVIVMGATNRIDCIDPALIRKGRFYQTLYIAPPNEDERRKLVTYFMTKYNLPEESYDRLLTILWDGMSGAEVENVCKEEALSRFNSTCFDAKTSS